MFLLLTGYLGSSKLIAVTLVSIGVGFGGFSLAGHCVNHIDIAPRFSGVLMGITNSAGTIPGIIGPVIAKAIAHSVSDTIADMKPCELTPPTIQGRGGGYK